MAGGGLVRLYLSSLREGDSFVCPFCGELVEFRQYTLAHGFCDAFMFRTDRAFLRLVRDLFNGRCRVPRAVRSRATCAESCVKGCEVVGMRVERMNRGKVLRGGRRWCVELRDRAGRVELWRVVARSRGRALFLARLYYPRRSWPFVRARKVS